MAQRSTGAVSVSPRPPHRRRPLFESLEERKLMALTVDVRAAGGGSTAPITQVGQVIALEVWATATGANGSGTDEGVQNLTGSLVSTNVNGGGALGDLSVTLAAPFNGTGSAAGSQVDLDADGDLDVGDLDPAATTTTGVILARSNAVTTTGGTVLANGQSFKVADVTFTVTQLLSLDGSAQTQVKWVPRISSNQFSANAVWQEDGATKRDGTLQDNGDYLAGAAANLTRATDFISGKVFNDKNGNGVFDGKDKRIKGAQLYLDANGDGQLNPNEKSVRSTGSGLYTFWNVPAGRHKMRINTAPEGFRITKPGASYTIQMTTGGVITGRNWGFTPLTIIPGSVFNDGNGNGVKDANEGVWAGWRVFADLNGDGLFSKTADRGTVTDAAGNFSLNTLPGGTWTLRALAPTGHVVTAPASGAHTITLGNGQTSSSLVFGVRKIA